MSRRLVPIDTTTRSDEKYRSGVGPDDGAPVSYLALEPGTPVFSSDGERVGTVARVLQVPEEDLFEGLAVTTAEGARLVERSSVSSIAERAVRLTIDAETVGHLPPPEGAPVYVADPNEGTGPSFRDRWNRLFSRGRWKRIS
jgi:hypothetical protein